MAKFQITVRSDGGVRSLFMEGQRLTADELLIDAERRWAQEDGSELMVMHEFELEGDPSLLLWEAAKGRFEAFWAGYDAPRLPNDWRGCPVHDGDYHDRAHVVSMGDLHSHEPVAVALGSRLEIEALREDLKRAGDGLCGLWLDEVPVLDIEGVRRDFINYGKG